MAMAPFPSPTERIVASALLLLTATPPKFCLDDDRERSKIESCRGSSVSGDSTKSCTSLITTSDISTDEIRARKIRIMALAALRRQMNLKVVRRSRSRTQTTWKTISGSSKATASFGSETTESSCVSTTSSAASSARSRSQHHVSRSGWSSIKLAVVREDPMKRRRLTWSSHLRRKADAILKLLSGAGWLSEVKIRQTIGDSPDTSKALRMLLKLEKVKRAGSGGRHNPYVYSVYIFISLLFKCCQMNLNFKIC
ncbi:hypothetical protein ACFX12_009062 [Malus domestica]